MSPIEIARDIVRRVFGAHIPDVTNGPDVSLANEIAAALTAFAATGSAREVPREADALAHLIGVALADLRHEGSLHPDTLAQMRAVGRTVPPDAPLPDDALCECGHRRGIHTAERVGDPSRCLTRQCDCATYRAAPLTRAASQASSAAPSASAARQTDAQDRDALQDLVRARILDEAAYLGVDDATADLLAEKVVARLPAGEMREALLETCPYCAGRWRQYETEPRLVEDTTGHEWRHYTKAHESWSTCELSPKARRALARLAPPQRAPAEPEGSDA